MKMISSVLMCASMVLVAGNVAAQPQGAQPKESLPMGNSPSDGMSKSKKDMTMQECKDHMAMSKKDGIKKDDAMMKKEAMCTDMMKKDGTMKNNMGTEPKK